MSDHEEKPKADGAESASTVVLGNGEIAEIDSETLGLYDGKCALCKWFRGAYQRARRAEGSTCWVDDEGWCARFPPVFIGGNKDDAEDCDAGRFKQPGVYGGDECGEYIKGYEFPNDLGNRPPRDGG